MRKFLERVRAHAIALSIAAASLCIGGSLAVLAQTGGMNLLNPILTGHFINGGSGVATLQPTVSGGTITAGSTDTDGAETASAASGAITFAQAYATAPFCSVVDASATSTVSMPVYTISTTAITINTEISTHVLYWHCASKVGG